MAVYTQVDDKALAQFLTAYDIGQPISLKGIAEGVENSNYFLETNTGKFILTLYEKRVREEDLPYFLNLMAFAADKGLPSAGVRQQLSGKRLGRLSGKPAAIIDFLPGLSVHTPTAVQCAAAAAALADFHQTLGAFPQRRENNLSLDGWQKLAAVIGSRADKCVQGLASLIEEELSWVSVHWPDALRYGPTHSDLFPDNILFTGDRVTGIIDFYFACDDFLAYDLAVMVNSWTFNAKSQCLDGEKASAMIKSYEAKAGLSKAEKEALPVFLRASALRFLLTRLYDWLHQQKDALVVVKNPLDYLDILNFHRLKNGYDAYGF